MLSLEYKRKLAVEDYIKDSLKDSEIKDYYNNNIYGQVKASHILIPVEVEDSASDEEKAESECKCGEWRVKCFRLLPPSRANSHRVYEPANVPAWF